MIGALVLNWEATAAICVPTLSVCTMVVLCVRYIAKQPDDPAVQSKATRLGNVVTRQRDADVTEEQIVQPTTLAPNRPRSGPGIGGSL